MANADSFPMSMPPTDQPRFAPSVDKEKYTCCKCRGMLRPPVRQTQCGHRLCKQCLDDLLTSPNTICPGQDNEDEECVDLSNPENVSPDFGTERDLKKLPVLCDNAEFGCTVTPPWSKKAKHVEECKFRPVECKYRQKGCPYRGKQSDVAAHQEKCEYAVINCRICGKDILKRNYQKHEVECKNKPQQCRIVGKNNDQCNFTGKADELMKHVTNPVEMAEHIHKLNDRIAQLEGENNQLKEELRHVREEAPSTPAEANPEFQHKILKNQAKINERVYATERAMENLAPTELVVRQSDKLSQLQDVSKMHESRISRMEQGGAGTGATEDERNKLRSLESTVGMHDIRLAEYDLRFQCMESAGYDGVLIWKIKDYTRRKNDAISGRTLSLYSQPFYTSRFGYKMCARVYLNGDGMGKGSHMSLFFVIMKGDYDALLPWPFRQKVSLTLLDQDGGKKPLTDTFRPDPTSTSFRLPVGDMNIASGCPLFVAQSTLETRTYLKDDTIFIKVSVDTSDLNSS